MLNFDDGFRGPANVKSCNSCNAALSSQDFQGQSNCTAWADLAIWSSRKPRCMFTPNTEMVVSKCFNHFGNNYYVRPSLPSISGVSQQQATRSSETWGVHPTNTCYISTMVNSCKFQSTDQWGHMRLDPIQDAGPPPPWPAHLHGDLAVEPRETKHRHRCTAPCNRFPKKPWALPRPAVDPDFDWFHDMGFCPKTRHSS